MPYRFKRKESVRDGAVRMVCDQIDKAFGELTGGDLSRHDAVHQARKRFKKVRAVLRAARPSLGEVYKEENVWFRDAGRRFAAVRDSEALVETYDALHEVFADQMADEGFAVVREALVDRRDRIAEEEVDLQGRIDDLVDDLHEARERVRGWPAFDETGFDALGPGLAKTYSRARKGMKNAYDDPLPENYHEWRKRVKYHRYHMRMLRSMWKRVINARRKELHELTNFLGDNHDLDVLRGVVLEDPDRFGGKRTVQALLGLVDRRQAELQALARPLGRKCLAEPEDAFVDRFRAIWRAWRKGAKTPKLKPPT